MLGTNELVSSSRVDARRQVTDDSVSRGRVEEGVAKRNKSESKVTLEQDGVMDARVRSMGREKGKQRVYSRGRGWRPCLVECDDG